MKKVYIKKLHFTEKSGLNFNHVYNLKYNCNFYKTILKAILKSLIKTPKSSKIFALRKKKLQCRRLAEIFAKLAFIALLNCRQICHHEYCKFCLVPKFIDGKKSAQSEKDTKHQFIKQIQIVILVYLFHTFHQNRPKKCELWKQAHCL